MYFILLILEITTQATEKMYDVLWIQIQTWHISDHGGWPTRSHVVVIQFTCKCDREAKANCRDALNESSLRGCQYRTVMYRIGMARTCPSKTSLDVSQREMKSHYDIITASETFIGTFYSSLHFQYRIQFNLWSHVKIINLLAGVRI